MVARGRPCAAVAAKSVTDKKGVAAMGKKKEKKEKKQPAKQAHWNSRNSQESNKVL